MQLDHVNLSVTNLAQSLDWYGRVFGFEAVERGTWHDRPWAIVRSGSAMLALYEVPGRTVPSDGDLERAKHHGVAHVGLRITDEPEFLGTLLRENVEIAQTFRWPHSTSWYLVDPSGWEIEVTRWDDGEPRFSKAAASASA